MSNPTYEEMEAKRQEMIASFKDIATAMARCVSIIEDYARLSPSTLTTSAAIAAVESGAHAAQTLAAAAESNTIPHTGALSLTPATAAVKKTRARKEKKPKDPNAPKRPPSAYLLFQNDIRESIRETHPHLAYKDILNVISVRWKDLADDERKVYEDAYIDANTTFRILEEQYKGGGTVTVPANIQAAVAAAAAAEEAASTSDESSDEDEPEPEPPVVTKTPKTPVAALPAPAAAAPPSPAAAKKDKKRKNKEEEAAVAATLVDVVDKKQKKKKSKD